MAILLPLQMSWAGVGAYCDHETDTVAQHFGHHAHKHAPGSQDSASYEPTAAGGFDPGFDPDCALCVLGCIAAMPCPLAVPAAAKSFSHAIVLEPWKPVLHVLSIPERPNWSRLA